MKHNSKHKPIANRYLESDRHNEHEGIDKKATKISAYPERLPSTTLVSLECSRTIVQCDFLGCEVLNMTV